MKNTFKEFVEKLRQDWHKDKDAFFEANSLIEESVIIEESTKETEQITEDYTANLLEQKEYYTTLVKGSQTPSDVWAIKEYDDYIHLMLVQVKGTVTDGNPKFLTENQSQILRYFSKYVLHYFYKNNSIFKNKMNLEKPIFVSNGYLGVKINKEPFINVSPKPFTFWFFSKHKEIANANRIAIFQPHYFK